MTTNSATRPVICPESQWRDQLNGSTCVSVGVTYLYTITKYGYPPKVHDDFKALGEISKLGFHYLEMEGLGHDHTEQVWQSRRDLRKCLDDQGIHVHNFCAVDPELVSLNDTKRRNAYERFKRTAELGVFLGAETLHLASYAPPVEYLGKRPYALEDDYQFGDQFRMKIPPGFSWSRVWSVLVESCGIAAAEAGRYGRTIIMEPRVGEVVCSVDSLVRLIGDVGVSNFRANFDTGHFSAQRENVPLALMKLEGLYENIHISDNDPVNTEHVVVGEGKVDWDEFFRVLKLQNYRGYIGLDLGPSFTLAEDLRTTLERIRAIGARHQIPIEF